MLYIYSVILVLWKCSDLKSPKHVFVVLFQMLKSNLICYSKYAKHAALIIGLITDEHIHKFINFELNYS